MTRETITDDVAAVSLLDEPVRRRLYDWAVAQRRPVGREEAAGALAIGRALATFHLDRLAAAGLLDAGYKRLTGKRGPGAGRPARVYWRAQREFTISLPERRYERMAHLFAAALETGASVAEVANAAGQRLAAETPGAGRGRLLTVLSQNGYEPITDSDGTIRLRNCPFDALAEEHRPLVCGANLAIAQGISEGVGAGADLTPVLDPQSGYCCVVFKRDLATTAA